MIIKTVGSKIKTEKREREKSRQKEKKNEKGKEEASFMGRPLF